MIKEFVQAWDARKGGIEAKIRAKHPHDYEELVRWVVEILRETHCKDWPDPRRIHAICDGDYQGVLIFVIGSQYAVSSTYWYVQVNYGSCVACDTFQSINMCSADAPPTDEQVSDYMTLALHIVQGLKRMDGDPV